MALDFPSTGVLKGGMAEIDYVRTRLRDTKGQWLRVARESGVSHRAIYNVVYLDKDHRTSTISKLAAWFREQEKQAA